ncbi:hypothetical protein GTP45_01160 [Pseudoduganella sp. FT55W]|uniref:Primosomal replication protein PriB/PriC domain protein n=1 Tax=Duganella rivi TaxID=2666083 RepID=A0A7X4GL18_9BURK|nr:hypothetical protein [Duganella rivi]MYM65441.1 hypothetical protein [Duganella rivi]
MSPTPAEMIAKYLAAESALLEGKEARFGDRILRMEDLGEIRKGRQEWEQRSLSAQGAAAGRPTFGGLGVSLANFAGE